MAKRTPFPPVFWIANTIEVLERFAYYGIYMGFGIYMTHLGFSRDQLGVIQSIFLAFSYLIPVFSGAFADRYGFKKVLIISYLAYLPSILLLLLTRSFSGIALTMLSIGLAAGIFKPLISGTVRLVSDGTNKTLGFGIFYAMVNVGASFGPVVMGKLRAISWNHAFVAAAIAIGAMLIITILFYKEPEREIKKVSIGDKIKEIGEVLADYKFALFLVMLGVFFWLPLWAFFNLLAMYIDGSLDTAMLYGNIKSVFGAGVANFLSHDVDGQRRLLGETVSHSGYIIMILQVPVSRIVERFRAIPAFTTGLVFSGAGFAFLGMAAVVHPAWAFMGILFFAVGEMTSSPRIQEYITWLAPKEKAGLYMGTNFLATFIGASLSGVTYTKLFGYFEAAGNVQGVWYVLAAHALIGALLINLFVNRMGHFEEQSA